MKTTALTFLLLAGGSLLHAQSPVIGEIKMWYGQLRGNLTRMAEKMPEADYSFKPVPEIRTFGELMSHIAGAQLSTCSGVNGEMKRPHANLKTKAEIVAAMKESFDECDKAFDATTDANANTMINARGSQTSRLGLLNRFVVIHGNEEYGYGSIYLRLKGIVPPSSDNAVRKQ